MTDQAALRRRRRAHLSVIYRGGFDLTAEVRELCGPLVGRIAATAAPTHHTRTVSEVVAAVHQCALELSELVSERDDRRRTAHLSPETRGRALTLLRNARPRLAAPQIQPQDLVTGSWIDTLTEHAQPISGPLADYLAAAYPPGGVPRGGVSVSERVETSLRGIDRAVLDAGRHLDRLDQAAPTATATTPDPTEELRSLGIEL